MIPNISIASPSAWFFAVLPLVLIATFAWGVTLAWRLDGARADRARRSGLIAAIGGTVWMAVTGLAAASGVFLLWTSTPPPFMGLVVAVFALAIAIAFSRLGARLAGLPLWALIGAQSFRLPLEIVMHRLAQHGVMPEQMSYTGRNWDILTGISALAVAAALRAGLGGRSLATVWNIVGLGLLINILIVAIASTPRFAAFGPDRLNTFIAYVPFVWLPAVMVLSALTGHLIVFRALARQQA